MAKDPSFPFYASDWLGSTKRAAMTPAERGAYIDLLCHQWGDLTCSLEDNDTLLAALSGLGEEWLKGSSVLLRRCFPKHPTLEGRIANPRLLEIKAERDEWRVKCSKGGKKSGRIRRRNSHAATTCDDGKDAKGTSTTGGSNREVNGNSPSPSPSPSPSSSSCPSSPPTTTSASADVCRSTTDRSAEVRAVFDHYRTRHSKAHPTPQSSSKEWRKIRDRLKEGYTVSDLCAAIDGCHLTPHNLGANDRDTKYLGLELIMRDSGHVASFMENAEHPPQPCNDRERRTLEAAERWMQRMQADGEGE